MTLWQRIAIDTPQFVQFFARPSESQLRFFVDQLGRDPQANSFFEEDPPAWHRDPIFWVSSRFGSANWYSDLSEPEMVAWDHAMRATLELPELQSGAEFTPSRGDGVPTCLFDFAIEALEQAGRDASFLEIRPYRFDGLPAHVAGREPSERVYWPEHGVVAPECMEKMIEVFGRYSDLVAHLKPRDRHLARQLETEGPHVVDEVPDLLVFLEELKRHDATWYARLDS